MSRATPTIVAAVLLGLMSPEFGGQAAPAGQPPTLIYNIIDLGTLSGTASCRAFAMNDLGQVVGHCSPSPSGVDPRRGFMWKDGVMTNLGGVPGYTNVTPLAINNLGQIVGVVSNLQSSHAFLWMSRMMSDLNDLLPLNSGWELANANDINDAGQIVGWGYHSAIPRAYLYDGVEVVDLGTLDGNISVPWAINESGKVVGAEYTEDGKRDAFLWENGVMTRLGPFDGNYSAAYDINDMGVVVGEFGTIVDNPPLPPSESSFPFRWESGVIIELDPADLSPAWAQAINNLSQVVGSGDRYEVYYFGVAVLWQGSERHELYDLIPPDSQWQKGLGSAQDINDAGQIVGFSWSAPSDGNEHAYLLTPVSQTLPPNVTVWDPGTNPIPWPNNNPLATTRSLRFTVTGPAGQAKPEAIKITMVDLQHPNPANLATQVPPNFTTFDTRLNGVCNSGTLVGHHCDANGDCPGAGATCGSMVACTAVGETNGCARWVGKPGIFLESQDAGPSGGTYIAARLQCTPFYLDWKPEELITVVGAEIAPSSEYTAEVYGAVCLGTEDTCTAVSAPVTMYTRRSGDAWLNFNPPSPVTQPDALDVAAVVNKLKNLPGALVKAITQLQPNLPELNANVNALDIVAVVDAVRQVKYGFSGPCVCPSAVTCGGACGTGCPSPNICVKTCTGGTNAGDACINNTHCPGGGTCGTPLCRDRCGRCSP